MEANELRIGNLLQRKRDYKVITVEEVLSTRICYYNPDLSSFKPIAADLNGFEPVVLTDMMDLQNYAMSTNYKTFTLL